MPLGYAFLLLIILLPAVEIAGFIVFAAVAGILSTIFLTIATAFAACLLLSQCGVQIAETMRREIKAGKNPASDIIFELLFFVGAVFLLIPGFFTDTLGLVLLLPPVRFFLARQIYLHSRTSMPAEDNEGESPARPSPSTINLDRSDWRQQEAPERPGRD